MWRTVIFLGVLSAVHASTLSAAPAVSAQNGGRAEIQSQRQERIDALTRRGRLADYQKLLAVGRVSATNQGSNATGKSPSSSNEQAAEISNEAAIHLASLGFTAADVTAYRKKKVDLFDVANRLFSGSTTTTETMLLADTVLIATAGKVESSRARLDGFLSVVPLKVDKSLKGPRASGDTIYIARKSGITPRGTWLDVSSEPELIPGKQYLLVLSKNLYEQRVAQKKMQPDVGFNTLPYLIYEVSKQGALQAGPQGSRSGANPKNVQAVESELKNFTL